MRINPNAIILMLFTTLIGTCVTYFAKDDAATGALVGATTGVSIVTFFSIFRNGR
jgi:hypothetical protein